MTKTIRAVEITEPGGPQVLKLCQRVMPVANPGEVVIRVAYAGVNRPDALQRAGKYDPPPGASDLPGLEASGEIVEVGQGVENWRTGDRICALLPGGGYAEFAKAPAANCLPIPDEMEMKAAACLPETYFTVWSNVFMRGGLQRGERFLIHGGTSGIGTTAIQLAKAFGATVFATAGSDKKCALCRELGADVAVNYNTDDFVEIVSEHGGANLILDMVGGDYTPRNISALANEGRLVQIAFLRGIKAELNLAQVMSKRLTITGSTLRPQTNEAKAAIADELREQVWPLLANGTVAPVMDLEFALADAALAHERMENNDHIGKMVLKARCEPSSS